MSEILIRWNEKDDHVSVEVTMPNGDVNCTFKRAARLSVALDEATDWAKDAAGKLDDLRQFDQGKDEQTSPPRNG